MSTQPVTSTEDCAVVVPLMGKYSGEAYIDPEDSWVLQYRWCMARRHRVDYAVAQIDRQQHFLHVLLMKPPKGQEVDHVDSDGLNCRRSNMRVVSHWQNMLHKRRAINKSSRYKGVYWYKDRSCWVAHITTDGKMRFLGYFWDEEDAAIAYDNAALTAFGEYAVLNRTM